jgi:dTDP-4-dehydrorhamnose reductase
MIGSKRVLITGANGMLGSSLMKKLNCENLYGFSVEDMDITNRENVQAILTKVKPHIIIHTAAFTNVEDCEVEKDKAYLVNTIGTQNLVDYCLDKDVLFVYISSTGVYGTQKKEEAYNEFDIVNPTTIHHKSKVLGEEVVKNHLKRFLIIRTGWLYGGSKENQKNFVYKRYLEGLTKDTIYSDDSQTGNPTYIENLCNQIELMLKEKIYGLFNCVDDAQMVSRFEYVKTIIELFDLPCKVDIAPKGFFKRVAPVSKNESAVNYKLNLLGKNVMRSWKISLEDYINQLKEQI